MLEKITTDLETSKKLKELGFDIETQFYWQEYIVGTDNFPESSLNEYPSVEYYFSPPYNTNRNFKYVKAYAWEQIINEIPGRKNMDLWGINDIEITAVGNSFDDCTSYYSKSGDSLATTAAKLWIKLKENKII